MSQVARIFEQCAAAVAAGDLIRRETRADKEFHFQNWFRRQLERTGLNFDQGGRNSYPDFTLVKHAEGYEVKGLAYPGREASFDSNSQVPTGFHNGRSIYYVFGRYPSEPDGDAYGVIDLVVCHGDFLNADHDYRHENKSVKAFGSYGDIMIRDRKMYVVPTPFQLVEGVASRCTMILPADASPGRRFFEVGRLERTEADRLIVGYSFDLRTNALRTKTAPNPDAGKRRRFRAWRLKGAPMEAASMRQAVGSAAESEDES